jgi:hypothetical protein
VQHRRLCSSEHRFRRLGGGAAPARWRQRHRQCDHKQADRCSRCHSRCWEVAKA